MQTDQSDVFLFATHVFWSFSLRRCTHVGCCDVFVKEDDAVAGRFNVNPDLGYLCVDYGPGSDIVVRLDPHVASLLGMTGGRSSELQMAGHGCYDGERAGNGSVDLK